MISRIQDIHTDDPYVKQHFQTLSHIPDTEILYYV